jgi:hypothetical protein
VPIAKDSVYAIDIDGDGDNDVLSASSNDNKIAWYENQLYAVGVPNEPNNLAANATTLTCSFNQQHLHPQLPTNTIQRPTNPANHPTTLRHNG